MRLHPFVALIGGLSLVCLPASRGQETGQAADMRRLISTLVRQQFSSGATRDAAAEGTRGGGMAAERDVLTLPPVLVAAPILKVASPADTVRPVVPVVRPINYAEYVIRDQRRQDSLRDLLDLTDLARLSGDAGIAEKVRQEACRALARDPTPLERAMDRSANGGRY